MTTLQFKCTLLSDIILNQKAATEGPNATLDFIPGSNFMGIAAGELYSKVDDKTARILFHSGEVRFGDAHLAHGLNRTLHVPACMYLPKLDANREKCYIIHNTDTSASSVRQLQLKQCRSGYYDFTCKEAIKVNTSTNFAIKSAHDKFTRTSKDSQMYGYESLQAGSVMYFEVELDDDTLAGMVSEALEGKKRVGRSRSSQYGLVEIEEMTDKKFNNVQSLPSKENLTVVYSESRLIFLDDNGEPTFRPTAEQLGVAGGEILWEMSQIRTFQYAPWNFKRQCFDTDRCGLEKGSVIVVKGGQCKTESTYLGSYKNEGFGRVIYNPAFLSSEADGSAIYKLEDSKKEDKKDNADDVVCTTPLFQYLQRQKDEENTEMRIFAKVNEWVAQHCGNRKFAGETFASQWGTIRSMAAQQSSSPIHERLFTGKDAYLTHGTADQKWSKGDRRKLFEEFVQQFDKESDKRLAIINLASEMAKRSRKEEKK